MLNAALIGFGGIAQAHKNGYATLEKLGKVRLVAVCDIRKEAFEKTVEINLKTENKDSVCSFHCYTDVEEMLAKEQIDFVDICAPSYLHREIAVKMLERGYHVLCEKPMALNSEDCDAMLEAEQKSGKHFMVAQVLRFFPEYEYLKKCIVEHTYGKPLAAFFNRVSAPATWGWENWFMDYKKAGGCITDLHVHDIDIARYLFGEPEAVSCRAVDTNSKYDIVQTTLHYKDVLVTAHGAWASKKTKFSADYRVDFENATVVLEGGKVTVYPNDETAPFSPELHGWDGYTDEIDYFCDVVSGKIKNTRNPASSAAKTIRLIEAMKKSADSQGEFVEICCLYNVIGNELAREEIVK